MPTFSLPEEFCVGDITETVNSRERVTVLVCASVTGKKLPLLVVGKHKWPDGVHCETLYLPQPLAWVDQAIASEWFERVFVPGKRRLLGEGAKAVLVWDTAPPHCFDDAFLARFPDVVVITAHCPRGGPTPLLPWNCGVLSSLRCGYKSRLVAVVDELVCNWGTVRDAIRAPPTAGIRCGHPATIVDACKMLAGIWAELPTEIIVHATLLSQCLPDILSHPLLAHSERSRSIAQARHGQGLDAVLQLVRREVESDMKHFVAGIAVLAVPKMEHMAVTVATSPADTFCGPNGQRHAVLKGVVLPPVFMDKRQHFILLGGLEENENVMLACAEDLPSRPEAKEEEEDVEEDVEEEAEGIAGTDLERQMRSTAIRAKLYEDLQVKWQATVEYMRQCATHLPLAPDTAKLLREVCRVDLVAACGSDL
jgi:hypothetical protein